MPPPSPVWDWNFKERPAGKYYHDATFQMAVRIEGKLYVSKAVTLKVKDPNKKK